MNLFESPVVVLDTETTGLYKNVWANVIDLGAVKLDVNGNEIDQFSSLIYQANIPAEADTALQKNKITRAEIQTAPPAIKVIADFKKFLGTTNFVTSYNVSFDKPFVESRLQIRKLIWCDCIMERVSRHKKQEKFMTLQEAAQWLEIELPKTAHRALPDALLAARVLVKLRQIEKQWEKDHACS